MTKNSSSEINEYVSLFFFCFVITMVDVIAWWVKIINIIDLFYQIKLNQNITKSGAIDWAVASF